MLSEEKGFIQVLRKGTKKAREIGAGRYFLCRIKIFDLNPFDCFWDI